MIRKHLQWSVPALLIMAMVCFMMVFVVSLMLIENLEDKIRTFTPIRMHNYTTWAHIPGRLEYDYTKSVTLYGIDK